MEINPNGLLKNIWSLWQSSELSPKHMSSQNHAPSLFAKGYDCIISAFIVSFFLSNHILS